MTNNRKPSKKPNTKAETLSWRRLDLETSTQSWSDPLDVTGKLDGIDRSQHHVREGRFSPSFMTATNGGAIYEDVLRPLTHNHMLEANNKKSSVEHITLQNVIGNKDDRILITDTSWIPTRSIGLLKIFSSDGSIRWGTAWLIGPRTLATAAHNLIHPESGKAIELHVGLAYDGISARGNWHKIIDNTYFSEWENEPIAGSSYDFAVLKIEDGNIGNRLGWLGFADYEDQKFHNLLLNIFGYPMDLKQFYMYGATGRAISIDKARIYHDCDAGGGMSGGPLIARFGEQRIVVGIHVAGGAVTNVATRITSKAYSLLQAHKSW